MGGRLSLATLDSVPRAARPPYDPAAVGVGIAHLGIGAFARAHLAVYTDGALAGGGPWGICGVSQRSPAIPALLRPQDGLYTVLERSAAGTRARVVGSVRQVLAAPDDPEGLTALLAGPSTRIVSLTVTEKGYRHDPATGRLRLDDPEVVADLAGRPPRTVVGRLARGLQARRAAGGGGVTVLCCDNLPENGRTVRGLVTAFCAALDEDLAAWVDAEVAFPATMVDRIVPAPGPSEQHDAALLLGLEDRAAVSAEPYRRWVVEDAFAAGRPAWESDGALLVADVAPHEAAKLRLLNGAHSLLAYLGLQVGHTFVHEAVADPALAEAARGLMAEDAAPTLTGPDGLDPARYQAQILERFADPTLPHRLAQIAMDGSQKLPQRLLGTARDRLAAGAEPTWVALAVAAWMRHVATAAELDDPLAGRLRAAAATASGPAALVDRLLGVEEVFGADLRDSGAFRTLVADRLAELAAGAS